MAQSSPAVLGPVQSSVRPRAWALPIAGVYGGGDYLRSAPSANDGEGVLKWEPLYDGTAVDAMINQGVAAERDCRTCKHWTPHHRSDVMHCSAPLRCVAGGSYQRQGVVQLWEAAPVDAGF